MRLDPPRLRLLGLIALVGVAVIAAFVVLGGEESEEERVRASVESFFTALNAADYEAACAHFTVELADPERCALGLANQIGEEAPQVAVEIVDVRVAGERAAVNVEATVEGQEARFGSLELVSVGEEWQISELGD